MEDPGLVVVEEEEHFYERIEAPKFIDFTILEIIHPDHRSWFCARISCDQNHEDVDLDELNIIFMLQVIAARSPNVRFQRALNKQGSSASLDPLKIKAISCCYPPQTIAQLHFFFAQIQCKDQILWSSLISSYFTNNKSEEEIMDFHRMTRIGLEIDHITTSSILGACAQLFRPILGRQQNGQAIKASLILYNYVASALLTLYAKCGIMSECRKFFDEIQNPGLMTWIIMIEGYAQHGRAKEALETFDLMKNNGIKLDSVTFIGILSACSHNGLVNEGFFNLKSMSSDYGIEPGMHHYSCMVDFLGKAGRLNEAIDFIDRMPMKPGLLVWSTLLGACRVYGDTEIGNIVEKKVLDLESYDSGAHITTSNMSADMRDWEQVVRIRSSMKGFRMKKEPGWSAL